MSLDRTIYLVELDRTTTRQHSCEIATQSCHTLCRTLTRESRTASLTHT